MALNAVKMLQERLLTEGLASPASIQGCTEEEIADIEARFGIRLPILYREFLRKMGRNAGNYLKGIDYSFPKMLQFRDWAEELIRECESDFCLPATAVVFLFNQGCSFAFFHCDGSDDPAIHMFTEDERDPRQVFGSFSQLLGTREYGEPEA